MSRSQLGSKKWSQVGTSGIRRHQDGSALVVVVAVGALCGLAIAGFGMLGRSAIEDTRAQTAADATALAHATEGPTAARRVSAANRAVIVSIVEGSTVEGSTVEVVVSVGSARALAAADRPRGSVGQGSRAGLAPAMLASLARAEELLGYTIPIVSGYRSHASQQVLWDNRDQNSYPVARPGTSRHESGLAVDILLSVVTAVSRVGSEAGLCHPLPEIDPVHFIVCPARP